MFLKMVNEDLQKAAHAIEKNVANDIYGYLMATVHGTSYTPKQSGMDFGSILGQAFGRSLVKIAEAIW